MRPSFSRLSFSFALFSFVFCSSFAYAFSSFKFSKTEYVKAIIWLQIPGLDFHHSVFLSYLLQEHQVNPKIKSEFESADCIGSLITANSHTITPALSEVLLGQLSGKRTLLGENKCEILKENFAWHEFEKNQFLSGILEKFSSEEQRKEFSLFELAPTCPNSSQFLDSILSWIMAPGKKIGEKEKKFSFQEKNFFEFGNSYWDKTCTEKECYALLSTNLEYLLKEFFYDSVAKNLRRRFLLVRDFTYYAQLQKKDIPAIGKTLLEFEKVLQVIQEFREKNPGILFFISSALPASFTWEKKQGLVPIKEIVFLDSLTTPLFAWGPRSSLICGHYNQHDLLTRLFAPTF